VALLESTSTKDLPIGIFDSGVGGLTVAKAILKRMPSEHLLYFGDTAHMPYGDRSADHILEYSRRIADFLYQKGIKLLVIACNSASAVSFLALQQEYKGIIDVVGVIRPVVSYVVKHNINKLGIIGTKATIAAGTHEKLIKAVKPEQEICTVATPLLAPMIEEGFFNNMISQSVIDNYLSCEELCDIDALVLACTHYPLIKQEINLFYKNKVDLIDPSEIVADYVFDVLHQRDLLATDKKQDDLFFVSEHTDNFEQTTQLFYGKKVNIQEVNIWNQTDNL
jgi:glutamate racemase